jgi:hypothetical protein
MALYVWGSDTSGELGEKRGEISRNSEIVDLTHLPGLGGSGIEDDSISCPHKMEWEESENLQKAALGGQVNPLQSHFPFHFHKIPENCSTPCC